MQVRRLDGAGRRLPGAGYLCFGAGQGVCGAGRRLDGAGVFFGWQPAPQILILCLLVAQVPSLKLHLRQKHPDLRRKKTNLRHR